MGSTPAVNLERGIAGEFNKIISKRTGIKMEGVIDPFPFLILEEIRETAVKMGCLEDIEPILKRCERRTMINQMDLIRDLINDDISNIAVSIGHQQLKKKNPLSEFFEGI